MCECSNAIAMFELAAGNASKSSTRLKQAISRGFDDVMLDLLLGLSSGYQNPIMWLQ